MQNNQKQIFFVLKFKLSSFVSSYFLFIQSKILFFSLEIWNKKKNNFFFFFFCVCTSHFIQSIPSCFTFYLFICLFNKTVSPISSLMKPFTLPLPFSCSTWKYFILLVFIPSQYLTLFLCTFTLFLFQHIWSFTQPLDESDWWDSCLKLTK